MGWRGRERAKELPRPGSWTLSSPWRPNPRGGALRSTAPPFGPWGGRGGWMQAEAVEVSQGHDLKRKKPLCHGGCQPGLASWTSSPTPKEVTVGEAGLKRPDLWLAVDCLFITMVASPHPGCVRVCSWGDITPPGESETKALFSLLLPSLELQNRGPWPFLIYPAHIEMGFDWKVERETTGEVEWFAKREQRS